MTFKDFDLHPEVAKGVRIAGFKEPSPIQKEAIPIILEGRDLVGQAHTGTGKTAAFGLPILDRIARGEIERALVITPTRELATQVSDELYHLGRFAGIRTLAVYGGVGYGRQIALIHRGVQIVVATPGRLKDLYQKGKIDVFNPEVVVLDEADEMLDMGFLDDVREIFEYIPQNRQTLLFSATMPDPIKELADTLLYEPEFISVVGEETTKNVDIEQYYYVINENQRDEAIVRLLETENYDKALIFCRMKREVDRLAEELKALGFNAAGLHGDIDQMERDAIVKSFRRGETRILIATDVAARGLDIKNVTHVFNYHIPFDPQSYVHRIGRTGRAGKRGRAITLASTEEFRELQRIRKEVGADMKLATLQVAGSGSIGDEQIEMLSQKLQETALHPMVDQVLAKMSDMDQSTFIKKAISYILETEEFDESDRIGYDEEELEALLGEFEATQRQSKSGKKRKRRR
ncbi:DEAD/DEAH box helicase [Nitratifractor salsuginis]|uniref:DEAD/DEAH box helicase domain protein n=1 Tax=Nitratifractor salsuginis (strain DSM 16511 / JCM 12458 / E9I37-1) TaxID=749222 RepID=E6WYS5_NITSE|nr:DEAD/DEAH box helicase [Nitratifractor salsuginis]ADV46511.1 DEAD/DEAH box helicase domain protein [Nitratifractor salsuginis DSM 16511]